ncbi:Na+/H+ antiporter 1 [Nitrosospira multiformis]|uniref:Na+/H+ antiporter 1 n=2 Tax=Nitrosospira multiformis TaxID=1231 RepID=A0A2T5I1G9_9PROT|nr:Na+/H+ antiporter 1 [Nitrosospira multiformis]
MSIALLALVIANSPAAPVYFGVLGSHVLGLSVLHWINDALMSLFFLLVGLEIKREFLEGQLKTWPDRLLPGVAALGGMLVPALIYIAFNWSTPETLRGWAMMKIPHAPVALRVGSADLRSGRGNTKTREPRRVRAILICTDKWRTIKL